MPLTPQQNEEIIERAYTLVHNAVDRLLIDQRVEVVHRHTHHIDAEALIVGWQDSVVEFLDDLDREDRKWRAHHVDDPSRGEEALARARQLVMDLVTKQLYREARLHPRHRQNSRQVEEYSPSVELAEYRIVCNDLADALGRLIDECRRLKGS